MRPLLFSIVVAGSALSGGAGCKRSAPPPPASSLAGDGGDAGDVSMRPDPGVRTASADAGPRLGMMGVVPDAGARPTGIAPPLPALPLASDSLELVAVGRSSASKILWLSEHGSRMWLSGSNLDAYADGDGPLTKGPDLLAKFPYKPGVHRMHVVGSYPKLYALRTKNIQGRMESPEPTLFVYAAEEGGAGTWKAASPLGLDWFPHAFIAYREGALVVNSVIVGNAEPFFTAAMKGTTLTYLAPDGTLSDPKLELHPHFMAWGASSDRSTLTLIGAFAIPPPKGEKDAGFSVSGAQLLRIGADGATRKIPLQQSIGIAMETYGARVHENAGKALAVGPPSLSDTSGWKGGSRRVLVIDDDKPRPRMVPGTESCMVMDARLVADVVYAIRECFTEHGEDWQILRVDAEGKTEKLALPRLVKDGAAYRAAKTDAEQKKGLACRAEKLVVRGASDLWATAHCGDAESGVPIVLRRGRPQEPVVIP